MTDSANDGHLINELALSNHRSKSVSLPMSQDSGQRQGIQGGHPTPLPLTKMGRSKSASVIPGGDGRQIFMPNPIRRLSTLPSCHTTDFDGAHSDNGGGRIFVPRRTDDGLSDDLADRPNLQLTLTDSDDYDEEQENVTPYRQQAPLGRMRRFSAFEAVPPTSGTPSSQGGGPIVKNVPNRAAFSKTKKPSMYDQNQRQFSCETLQMNNLSHSRGAAHSRTPTEPSSSDDAEAYGNLSSSIHRITMGSPGQDNECILNSPMPPPKSRKTFGTSTPTRENAFYSHPSQSNITGPRHPGFSLLSPSKCFAPLSSCPNTPATQASSSAVSVFTNDKSVEVVSGPMSNESKVHASIITAPSNPLQSSFFIDRVDSNMTDATDLELRDLHHYHNSQFVRSRLSRDDSFASPGIERVGSNVTTDSVDMEVRDLNRREVQRRKLCEYQQGTTTTSSGSGDHLRIGGITTPSLSFHSRFRGGTAQRPGAAVPLSAMSIDEDDTLTVASASTISSSAYWMLNAEPKKYAGAAPPSPYRPREGAVLSVDRWFGSAADDDTENQSIASSSTGPQQAFSSAPPIWQESLMDG
jgi:hypothetical protein